MTYGHKMMFNDNMKMVRYVNVGFFYVFLLCYMFYISFFVHVS